MVKPIKIRVLWSILLSGACLLILTGCPGPGDRMIPDETAQVSQQGGDVCFTVKDEQDYQLADIGINPRGTPSKDKDFNFSPALTVANGQLCIPPSFYRFPEKGQFIIEYLLKSETHKNAPRNVVVTLEVNYGHIYNVTPTEREITLPYCRNVTNTPPVACQL